MYPLKPARSAILLPRILKMPCLNRQGSKKAPAWWLTKPTNRRIAFCVSFFQISMPWLCSNRALIPAGARKLGKSRCKPFQCPEIPRKYLFQNSDFRKIKRMTTPSVWSSFGGDTQTRTGGGAFAELCLTTWLCRPMDNRSKALAPVIICMEQVTRLELATSTLARWRSTR